MHGGRGEVVRSFISGVLGLLMATCASAAFADGLQAVWRNLEAPQFYVSGIVGASFAALSSGGMNTAGVATPNTGTVSDDLFTAGGALGIAFERPHGLLRAEVEGRGREQMLGETASVEPFAVRASDGWSAMANVWRDYFLTERLGLYGGGGIGAGGYRLSVEESLAIVTGASAASEFAWQAGGGVTYRVGAHITLDLGYRFLDLGRASTPLVLGDGSSAGNYTSAFSTSEVLLTVRIYEPFRQFCR